MMESVVEYPHHDRSFFQRNQRSPGPRNTDYTAELRYDLIQTNRSEGARRGNLLRDAVDLSSQGIFRVRFDGERGPVESSEPEFFFSFVSTYEHLTGTHRRICADKSIFFPSLFLRCKIIIIY